MEFAANRSAKRRVTYQNDAVPHWVLATLEKKVPDTFFPRNGFTAMQRSHWQSVSLILWISVFAAPSMVVAEDLESFTEPSQRIAIPAAETGVISQIFVSEGDPVSKQQSLAKLEDSVLNASLEVTRSAKDALGARRGAEAELDLRSKQLESYRELHQRGNATHRELERAEGDLLQAQTRLQSVREELQVRRLEYERVKAQINVRRMESPIDGIVVQIDKEVGEFVSPTDPIVMHIVQLDTLKSEFSVPMQAVKKLAAGQTVTLSVGYQETKCEGVIDFVSPIADAQSATVRVKIRIPNHEGLLPCGAVCRWDLNVNTPVDHVSRTKIRENR